MFYKFALVLLVCNLTAILATPVLFEDEFDQQPYYEAQILSRQVRSPQGSLGIEYGQNPFGKTGSIQYNQRLYTGDSGRFTVDGYARGTRDFTNNRNDYGGGVVGTWRF